MRKDSYVVAVGGLDPSGYSGVLADSKVFQNFCVSHKVVLTAVTAQSKNKFFNWRSVDLTLFRQQLRSVQGKIFGVKLGMLATLHHARVLITWLKEQKPRFILWDPVLYSSTGKALLQTKAWNPTLQELFTLTHLFTPNIPEAEWILKRNIRSINEMKTAIADLQKMQRYNRGVLLKGGHLNGASPRQRVYDLFTVGKKTWRFSSFARPNTPRGTGCTLGSAILATIYQGRTLKGAVQSGRRYVLERLFDAPTP